MRFLKNLRTTEVVEDPAIVARREGIAARCRAETSLYEAIRKAQQSQGTPAPPKREPRAEQ